MPRLISRLVLLAAIFTTPAFAAQKEDAGRGQCARWLTRALDKVESTPMLRRRDMVVSATERACRGVAEALRAAAAGYAMATSEKVKAQILANGAAEVLRERRAACAVTDPLASAEPLVESCPLPGPGEKAHPQVLGRMRAADYVFVAALITSLIAAGEHDETAHRLVLQFILSSAQIGDQERSARQRQR